MDQTPDSRLPHNPNIIYMGTPDFAVPGLKSLVKEGYNISAVITQPDRPKGRGRGSACSPVKETAIEHGLNILQPQNINDNGFISELKAIEPDLFIVAAFGQILNKDVLAIPKFGAINIHASLLPKYRGAAPIQWAILNNEAVAGITLMKMVQGLDKGPVLMKEEIPITQNETAGQLFDKLADISGDIIVKFLKEFAGKELDGEPQDDTLATYASKISKELAEIDWNEDAIKIALLIRAMDPAPGATTNMDGKKIKLFSPVVIDTETVKVDHNNRLIIQTGKGQVEVGEIQLPGKKRISTSNFLRGNKVEEGTFLGN